MSTDPRLEAKRPTRHIFLYGSLQENPPPLDYRSKLLKLLKPLSIASQSLELLAIADREGHAGNELNPATWEDWQQVYAGLHLVGQVLKSEFGHQAGAICDHPAISRAANQAINWLGVCIPELLAWMTEQKVLQAGRIPALPVRYHETITKTQRSLNNEIETITVQLGKANTPRKSAGRGSGRKAGKPLLEESNPIKFQVYQRIQQAHAPGENYVDTLARLKGDKDFVQQVKEAGEKLDTKLVRRVMALFGERMRAQARKQQETNPG